MHLCLLYNLLYIYLIFKHIYKFMWNFLKDQLYYDSYKSSTDFNINIYHIPRYSLKKTT